MDTKVFFFGNRISFFLSKKYDATHRFMGDGDKKDNEKKKKPTVAYRPKGY